ncbi:MAG: DinB family protein [Bryobacteraceae bacterium]
MNKVAFLAALPLLALPLCAQSDGSNPLTTGSKQTYMIVNNWVLGAAEEMPEKDYSFRPTPKVRTFGQLVAHEADAQYEFCSAVIGSRTRGPQVEKNVTGKANLITALKQAFEYCDKAYDGMTDAHAADMVTFMRHSMPKLTVLDFNTAHMDEHYGNMVTYLRIKGFVPPSSQHSKK